MRILLLGSLLLIASCGTQESKTPKPSKKPTATAKPTVNTGHVHTQEGQQTVSMSLSLAGITLDVNALGALAPNSEYHVEMSLIAGTPGATVRLWIGEKTGVGSMKTKADGHGDHYHAHLLAPKEINEKTAMWVEVQSVTGDREIGRIALQ